MKNNLNMKNLKVVLIVPSFVLIFVVFSCKKKKDEKTEETVTQNSPDLKMMNGLFQSARQYTFHNDTLKLQSASSSVILYDSLVASDIFDATKGIDAGSISINNIMLQKFVNINIQPNTFFYSDSLNSIIDKPCNWSISGKGSFMPLIITDDYNFPLYTGYHNLPDTIFFEKSNTISINNYWGAERIEITLKGVGFGLTKILYFPKKSVVFEVDEMTDLEVLYGEPVDIIVALTKTDFKYFKDKVYQFKTGISLSKHCEFKKARH
jgi:hypothetical protein